MKIVYPVTRFNAALYGQLSTLFDKLGPQRDHEIYIVVCPSALEAAQEFAESVKRKFKTCEIGVVAQVVEKGATARNSMFRDAVYLLESKQNVSPWIWMEDAYPLDRDWLDMIQDEWNCKPVHQLFLGCEAKTFFRAKDANGNVTTGDDAKFLGSDPHMRFGVYPPNLSKHCVGIKSLDNIPFEIDLRGEIVHRMHHSQVIKTIWASVDFSYTRPDYIKGAQDPRFESEIRRKEPLTINVSNAAILHGCRDASLGMALIKRDWTEAGQKRPAHRAVYSKTEVSVLEAKIKELEERIAELVEQLKQSNEQQPVKKPVHDPIIVDQPVVEDAKPLTPQEIYGKPTETAAIVENKTEAPVKRKPGRPKNPTDATPVTTHA